MFIISRGRFYFLFATVMVELFCLPTDPVSLFWLSRPGFPREHFIRKLRQPDNCFQWKHNKLYLLLPVEYGPAFPAIVDCYTCPPHVSVLSSTSVRFFELLRYGASAEPDNQLNSACFRGPCER
ncbi:hypothetical protein GYM25_005049 [Escherichia coli]|nr:hypothetical protein [Escherichia coli]TIZ56362.1 hypothetical protein C9327_24180 [Escherichia coli]TJB52109.1 hypothetical protein C9287_24995 [Escherichia coli]